MNGGLHVSHEHEVPVARGATPAEGMRIGVTENGPYSVTGSVPLVRAQIVTDERGDSVAWRETERLDAGESCLLCRCGASSAKPFCDFSHIGVGFKEE